MDEDSLILVEFKITLMALSLAAWSIFYNNLRFVSLKTPRISIQYVSNFHGLFALVSLILTPALRSSLDEPAHWKGLNWLNFVFLTLSWGYCAFHLVYSFFIDDVMPRINQIHYGITMLLLHNYIFHKTVNREVILRGFTYLELTTPSLRFRRYLDCLAKDDSFYYRWLSMLSYTGVAVCRIGVLSCYIWMVLGSKIYDIGDKIVGGYFYLMGILMFGNVMNLLEGRYAMKYR